MTQIFITGLWHPSHALKASRSLQLGMPQRTDPGVPTQNFLLPTSTASPTRVRLPLHSFNAHITSRSSPAQSLPHPSRRLLRLPLPRDLEHHRRRPVDVDEGPVQLLLQLQFTLCPRNVDVLRTEALSAGLAGHLYQIKRRLAPGNQDPIMQAIKNNMQACELHEADTTYCQS